MVRVVILSGKAIGKVVPSVGNDWDGQMFADEGNVVIYGETKEDIEKATGLTIEMV